MNDLKLDIDLENEHAYVVLPFMSIATEQEQLGQFVSELMKDKNTFLRIENGTVFISMKVDFGPMIPEDVWDFKNYWIDDEPFFMKALILDFVKELLPGVIESMKKVYEEIVSGYDKQLGENNEV